MRNGCYSNNRDAATVINELIGRLNEFGEQCNAAQARGGGTHLDETKFQVRAYAFFFLFDKKKNCFSTVGFLAKRRGIYRKILLILVL